jgi:parvulin-like peptidyl-prolyl isomerase
MVPRRIFRLLLVLTLALSLAACARSGSVSADTAATVNGEAVPMASFSTLVYASKQKVGQVGIPVNWTTADGERRLLGIQSQALKQVVRNAVIGQLANKRHIVVSDDDLAKALSDIETSYGGSEGFEGQLTQDGLSRESFATYYRYTLLDRQMREADPTNYQAALDQAISAAKVRAYVGPCATDHDYPRCLGGS